MASVTVLNKIRSFLEKNVASDIKLQVPQDDDIMEYKLAAPAVHIGWVPPKGFLQDDVEIAMPCIVVSMRNGSLKDSQKEFAIRLIAVSYSPGLHQNDESGNLLYTPDFKGYEDLVNLIDKSVRELQMATSIDGLSIDSEIKWSIYDEQRYPFWYGDIEFSVSYISNANGYSKLLD